MALDPNQAFTDYKYTPCSVQFWVAGVASVEFRSLRAAVIYARDNGALTESVEITVHLPREDIAYGTEKVRELVKQLSAANR
ncbi:hypothetical protein [Rhizobium tubonense]|uniref:Uncharacterized protein n=1 Tax=Rhizobium tubonense TaxID=484088 RepID=A0A2W4C3V8_9HYPH|nr:hypothetical protein [Rhizobium tubonense]PZM08187.1 hypothetical protein CPY51_29645 [Rhizobium tubonense]